MKRVFAIIALAISVAASAQTDSTQKVERITASIRMAASHRKMVQFTGLGMSSSMDFQSWLDENFRALKNDAKTKFTNDAFILVYTKDFKPVKVIYTFNKNEIVTKVEISGSWKEIVNLFLTYWERPLRIDDKKRGEIVWFNSFADRVAFNSVDGISAKISITNNGLNTYQ